jgi:hypothetical protein
MKGLFMRFSNSRFEFNPAAACKVRFRKADGTFVDAAGYPYIKGKTVVCLPRACPKVCVSGLWLCFGLGLFF